MRVNDELVLDAGICEESSALQGTERLIRLPRTTLFHQVLAYLRVKPDPPRPLSGSMVGLEGVAAAALTLRWRRGDGACPNAGCRFCETQRCQITRCLAARGERSQIGRAHV